MSDGVSKCDGVRMTWCKSRFLKLASYLGLYLIKGERERKGRANDRSKRQQGMEIHVPIGSLLEAFQPSNLLLSASKLPSSPTKLLL